MRGHLGRAGHWGHISLDHEGPPSITGMPGSLEGAVGNASLAARSKGRFRDARELLAAHRAGDAEATAIWTRSVHALGCAVASIVNAVDPEAVILGGGLALSGPALFEPLARVLDEVEWRPTGERVRVLAAELGEAAGALGAARAAMGEGPGDVYLARARSLLDVVSAQLPAIRQAASWFAETILAGRMVHVFGTGHSRIMVEEMWPRYGSFPGFNPMVELSLTFHHPVVGTNGQRQAMFLENVPGLAERILRNYDIAPGGFRPGRVLQRLQCRADRDRGAFPPAGDSGRRDREPRPHRRQPVPRAGGNKLGDFADSCSTPAPPAGDAMVRIEGLDTPVAPGLHRRWLHDRERVKAEVAPRLVDAGPSPPGAHRGGPDRDRERAERSSRPRTTSTAAGSPSSTRVSTRVDRGPGEDFDGTS